MFTIPGLAQYETARPVEQKKWAGHGIDGKILFRDDLKAARSEQVIIQVSTRSGRRLSPGRWPDRAREADCAGRRARAAEKGRREPGLEHVLITQAKGSSHFALLPTPPCQSAVFNLVIEP